MLQKDRTLQFWDDFYKASAIGGSERDSVATGTATAAQEWIAQPTPELLQQLCQHMVGNARVVNDANRQLRILEIGCGTSTLSRELWKYLKRHYQSFLGPMTLCATDASEVCIRQNQQRDAGLLQSAEFEGFSYQVLNVADPQISEMWPSGQGCWDVVLDKGCLDTFLFRSKTRGGGGPYTNLVRTVLDNIHTFLSFQSNPDAVYIMLTPRTKNKVARDYLGFENAQRFELDENTFLHGDLESKTPPSLGADPSLNNQPVPHSKQRVFLYVCKPSSTYRARCIEQKAFRQQDDHLMTPQDHHTCPGGCGLTFYQFRKGEVIHGRGQVFWFREWRGHCRHCKPTQAPASVINLIN